MSLSDTMLIDVPCDVTLCHAKMREVSLHVTNDGWLPLLGTDRQKSISTGCTTSLMSRPGKFYVKDFANQSH
jgi:hypothetical protein